MQDFRRQHKYTLKKHSKVKQNRNFSNSLCDNKMTFQECELAILRNAATETEKNQGKKLVENDKIADIIKIVESFISKKRLLCYGGTAINNILPQDAQFYDRKYEIPDYDFFSPNALHDAKELADIYYDKGYKDVEAKAGIHVGTFKVFVNFIPIADITLIDNELYNALLKESIVIEGIHYSPPNYLRMNLYLELSRPAGDVSRWEKLLKRLTILNKHYPITKNTCEKIRFDDDVNYKSTDDERLYFLLRDSFVNQGLVFFGGYAFNLYKKYSKKSNISDVPGFDVLSEEPEQTANVVKEELRSAGIKHIKIIHHESYQDIIPEHCEIRYKNTTLAHIYKPVACHSYNTITIQNKQIHVASIDTMLNFYLGFTYTKMPKHKRERLLCMAEFLFDIQNQHRLSNRGLLKRFSIDCYGKQETLEDNRAKKAEKFKELRKDRHSKEYEMYFLKYIPDKYKSKTPTTTLLTSPAETEKELEIDAEDNDTNETDVKQETKEEPSILPQLFIPHKTRKNQTMRKSNITKLQLPRRSDEYLF